MIYFNIVKERILIEGIGGIGGFVSAALIEAGFEVTMVTNNPQITKAIQDNGIMANYKGTSYNVEGNVYTKLKEVEGKYDIVLLTMKATGVKEAVENSLNYLKDGGYFVTMQNGIVEDMLTEVVEESKIITAIIGWGGTMHSPGVYEKTSPGAIHMGELNGDINPRILRLKAILGHVSPVVVSSNIRGVLWSKLAINSCITTLGAITGEKLGTMMKDKKIRNIFLEIYQEIVDTAHSSGIKLEKVASNPYLLYRKKGSGILNRWVRDQFLKLVGKKYSGLKSSMLQSIERGRKSEIQFLNAYVVLTGKKVNVDTPVNARCVEIVEEIELGKVTPSMDNIRLFE